MMSTLSKLPAEILEIIFQECLAYSWDALEKTPSLIAALRARDELKLYFQALEIFNKTNEYDLGGHNFHLFKTMPDTVLSTIRQLSITIDELNHSDQDISEVYKYFRSFRDLTKLTIYVFGECWDDWEDYSYDKPLVECMLCDFLEAIIPQCPDLRALVLGRYLSALLGAGRKLSHLNNLGPQITFNVHTIEEVNYRLGMEATNRRASAGPGNVQWQWIAKEGEPLAWKKRERRISQE